MRAEESESERAKGRAVTDKKIATVAAPAQLCLQRARCNSCRAKKGFSAHLCAVAEEAGARDERLGEAEVALLQLQRGHLARAKAVLVNRCVGSLSKGCGGRWDGVVDVDRRQSHHQLL